MSSPYASTAAFTAAALGAETKINEAERLFTEASARLEEVSEGKVPNKEIESTLASVRRTLDKGNRLTRQAAPLLRIAERHHARLRDVEASAPPAAEPA